MNYNVNTLKACSKFSKQNMAITLQLKYFLNGNSLEIM